MPTFKLLMSDEMAENPFCRNLLVFSLKKDFVTTSRKTSDKNKRTFAFLARLSL